MTHSDRDNQLVVPLGVDERELLNEWAVEVGIPVAELIRRLILRYLSPPRGRDDVGRARHEVQCSLWRRMARRTARTVRCQRVAIATSRGMTSLGTRWKPIAASCSGSNWTATLVVEY